MSLLLDGENNMVLRNQGVALGWSLKKCLGVAILFPLYPEAQSRIQGLCRQHGFTWMLPTQRHYILVSDLQRTKEPGEILEQSAFHFADALRKELPGYAFHIGVGQTYQKLLYASKSFKEAQIALTVNIGEQKERENPVTCFSRMGIFRILLDPDNKEELEEITDRSIHILAQYDRENGTEYYKTFLSFYEHDCSIKETAAALYVHYNTIRHRLSAINTILDTTITASHSLSIKALMLILQWRRIFDEIRY